MKIKVPYLIAKTGANGATLYYWQPHGRLRKLGWHARRLAHPDGTYARSLDEAVELAKVLNAELDAWRRGERPTPEGGQAPMPKAPDEVRPGSVSFAIRLYKASPGYLEKAPKTRYEYDRNLTIIENWAGKAPVKAISPEMVQEYYRALWATGKKANANAIIRMLRILLGFCRRNGLVQINAAEKPGLATLAPRLRVYTDAEISAILSAADAAGFPSIGDAVIYGCYLGQRQGDLLGMKRVQWQPDASGQLRVRLRQAKRHAWINVPLHPMVERRFLAAEARRTAGGVQAPTVIWNERLGTPWNADTFRHHFSAVRAAAAQIEPTLSPTDVVGPLPVDVAEAIAADPTPAWFMDTRDTAVTKLAEAGCTIPEVCAITGHDEESAYKVLKHYLALNGSMADAAIAKLVAFEEQKRARSGTSN